MDEADATWVRVVLVDDGGGTQVQEDAMLLALVRDLSDAEMMAEALAATLPSDTRLVVLEGDEQRREIPGLRR